MARIVSEFEELQDWSLKFSECSNKKLVVMVTDETDDLVSVGMA